jgi:hypothetical protein
VQCQKSAVTSGSIGGSKGATSASLSAESSKLTTETFCANNQKLDELQELRKIHLCSARKITIPAITILFVNLMLFLSLTF